MGGRSASYVYQGSSKSNLRMTDTFDTDKESTRELRIAEKLKNRNIKIMASSDVIPYEIITPNLKMIDKIMSTTREYMDIMGDYKLHIRAEKFSNSEAQAAFYSNPINFDKAQVIYNYSFKNKTDKHVIKTAENSIESGWWTKSDKNNYINKVIAHEMSHFVQRVLLDKFCTLRKEEKKRANNPAGYELDTAERMRDDILSIAKNEYNCKVEAPSRYGKTNAYEFFAESYSEVLCVNKKEDLSPIAKATEKYVRRLNEYVTHNR